MQQQDENLKARLQGLFEEQADGLPTAEPALKLTEHDLVIERTIMEILDTKNGAEKTATDAVPQPAPEPDIAILFQPGEVGVGTPTCPEPPAPASQPGTRLAPPPVEQAAPFPWGLAALLALGSLIFFGLMGVLALRPGRWVWPMLYWAAYAALLLVIVARLWRSNRALRGALQEAGQRYAQARDAQRLAEEAAGRTRALEEMVAVLRRQIAQMQAAREVTGALAAAADDPDHVARRAADVIQKQFGLYHVGVYLVDPSGEWAVLKGGTGEAGRQRLSQGHKVNLRESSIGPSYAPQRTRVGRCILDNRASLAVDEGKITRLLPETRSEIVVPLRRRGPDGGTTVIGALELHSDAPDTFTSEDLPLLQAMADQIATALENARLLAAARADLGRMEETRRRQLRDQWERFMRLYGAPVYERAKTGAPPLKGGLPAEIEQAITRREMIVRSNTGDGSGAATLIAPISLRDEPLGVLGLVESKERRQWTEDEIALIEAVADQMALAIENARLLEETRQRAELERVIAEITAQVRASTQVDTILRTAVRELGRTLRASEGVIQLVGGEETLGSRE